MDVELRPGLVFLAIEVAGVSLTGVLTWLLWRETGRSFVCWWAAAWAFLAASLFGRLAWDATGRGIEWLLLPHVLGDYAFAVLVARGFTVYRHGAVAWRGLWWTAAVLAAWSIALVLLAGDAGRVLRAHALVLGALLVLALDEARRAPVPGGHRTGRRVSLIALSALAVNFAALALLGWTGPWPAGTAQILQPFAALLDLVLFTGLGFGQALLVMETVSAALARTNADLAAARDRLEVQVRVDPLTSALNRHAFHSLIGDRGGDLAGRSGCVVVIDIDHLKCVNDTLGHAAGDEMIRAAAAAIRRVVRADDLLFRWGGDEFLAILFGIGPAGVDARMRELTPRQAGQPGDPPLSWGVAAFETLAGIADAIEAADRAMYAGRTRRRSAS